MDSSKNSSEKIKELQDRIAEMEKSIRRLTISRQLTQEFASHVQGVKHLIELVFDHVLKALDAQAGSLWLVDKRSELNICHMAEGPAKKRVIGVRLGAGEGVVGSVIKNKEPEIILNCRQNENFSKDVDKKTGFVTRSMICVPLVADGEAYGAIQIVNKKNTLNGQFDENDCELVKDLALSASIAVKNARLLEMKSQVKEMHTLMSISNEVVSTLDLDQVLSFVVNKTNELVDVSLGAVALWDENKETLKLSVISGGVKVDLNEPVQVDLLALMEKVRHLDRSSYVSDRASYKKSLSNPDNPWVHYMEENDLNAIWTMRLEDDEGVLGVLWFESEQSGFANGNKADMLHILSSQATVALRNASLFKSIPIGKVLGNVSHKSKKVIATGWKKGLRIAAYTMALITSLHYMPIFRWVSGSSIVEARLGQGVFLPMSGRIDKILVTEGQKVTKGDKLVQLDSSEIKLILLETESQLAILERQIVEARANSDAATMRRSIIERDAVRAMVSKAKHDLEQISIRSPIDGLVLTTRPKELTGRSFSIGDEVLRLADPENLLLIIHVQETDLLDVEVGQTVKSVLRSQPGEYIYGKIRHLGRSYEIPTTVLDSSAELESKETLTGFIAEVEVTDSPVKLYPGMTGQALIHTPKTSIVIRLWRRISNFLTFTIGL